MDKASLKLTKYNDHGANERYPGEEALLPCTEHAVWLWEEISEELGAVVVGLGLGVALTEVNVQTHCQSGEEHQKPWVKTKPTETSIHLNIRDNTAPYFFCYSFILCIFLNNCIF